MNIVLSASVSSEHWNVDYLLLQLDHHSVDQLLRQREQVRAVLRSIQQTPPHPTWAKVVISTRISLQGGLFSGDDDPAASVLDYGSKSWGVVPADYRPDYPVKLACESIVFTTEGRMTVQAGSRHSSDFVQADLFDETLAAVYRSGHRQEQSAEEGGTE